MAAVLRTSAPAPPDYLFAAIDARKARAWEQSGGGVNGRVGRTRYSADELKRLVVEASEAVDDKSAANEFQETLERIVNEIKNTTEHSGPFLQKVRKADVPDYYDVIKRPMDLATLLKKVKQQSYRTKKAFAEDLDLIWSNCLLYNSHPSHPLRHSAEVLRAKSNQLLEFITDPTLSQRSLLAGHMSSAALDAQRAGSTRVGTPDEDADADAESDDEPARHKRALSERLLNGINGGTPRDSSASPAPSRSATPGISRRLSRKFSAGPLGRISPSPEPTPPPLTGLPFEEQLAFVRTPQAMHEFLLLDSELCKLEGSGFKPTRSTASALLPPYAFEPASSTVIATKTKRRTHKEHIAELVHRLNPDLLPKGPTESALSPENSPALSTPAALSEPRCQPTQPLEAFWWDIVGPAPFSSALVTATSAANAGDGVTGHDATSSAPPAPSAAPALAAGMPHVPWVGYSATPLATSTGSRAGLGMDAKGRSKQRAEEVARANGASKPATRRKEADVGLAPKMRRNCETWRRIRRVGAVLARESTTADMETPVVSSDESETDLPPVDGMDVGGARPAKRRRRGRAMLSAINVPRQALACPATAPLAAREAMRSFAGGMLAHAGFEGANSGGLDVLSHVTGEYLTNLARTLRFYSDRYGADMSDKRILVHALGENGVPSPAHLQAYVSEDIDRYGSRLSDLLAKLERTRRDQLDLLTEDDKARADHAHEALFADNGEAFVAGDYATRIGEDFFGLAEQGLDQELSVSSLVLPKWILRGEPRPLDSASASSLAYSPPPAFVPLPPDAVSSQIGLLRPYLSHRAARPDLGLADEAGHLSGSSSRSKTGLRHKVPPHGRIPFKGKRRPDDPTMPAAIAAQLTGANEPKKKKKKVAQVEEALVESGGE
ncbi:Transcriptional activator spt7 [Rhodotorula toruloides]